MNIKNPEILPGDEDADDKDDSYGIAMFNWTQFRDQHEQTLRAHGWGTIPTFTAMDIFVLVGLGGQLVHIDADFLTIAFDNQELSFARHDCGPSIH